MLYELTPRYSSRKSFYGKAQVFEIENKIKLKSYDTIVAEIIFKKIKQYINI